MAQQTQIERVDSAWARFMARFPTPQALADAGPAEAVRAWQGLGYNRRAVSLHRAARRIVHEHGGEVPVDLVSLEALPGVGPYTARAVAATAHGAAVGAVDTNVRRVLSRLLGAGAAAGPADLQRAADALVPPEAAADWTHAVMDLGATVCRTANPRCGACPLAAWCRSAAAAEPPTARGGRPSPAPARGPVRFEDTNRWLRGRIVDRLRASAPGTWLGFDGPLGDHDVEAVREALAGLERDGLLERRPGDSMAARLPDDAMSVRPPGGTLSA